MIMTVNSISSFEICVFFFFMINYYYGMSSCTLFQSMFLFLFSFFWINIRVE